MVFQLRYSAKAIAAETYAKLKSCQQNEETLIIEYEKLNAKPNIVDACGASNKTESWGRFVSWSAAYFNICSNSNSKLFFKFGVKVDTFPAYYPG